MEEVDGEKVDGEKVDGENAAPIVDSESLAAIQLEQYINRLERCQEDINEIENKMDFIFHEIEHVGGFSKKIIKKIIKIRTRDYV